MEYFIANDDEISNSKSWNDIFDLILQYENFPSSDGFELFSSLSRVFFQNEVCIPAQIPVTIHKIYADGFEIYKYDQDFINKISVYSHEEIDSLAFLWREDKYWKAKNYEGMGIWVFLYKLNSLCQFAVKENKRLYVLEEKREQFLEG